MEPNDSKKVYSYQKRFTYIEAPLYSLIITLLLISWLPAVIGLFAYGVLYPSTIRFAVFLDISIIVLIGVMVFLRSEIKKSKFLISEDAIIFKAPGKLRHILFDDMTLCKHVQTSLSEHVLIVSVNKSITLPFSIHGIHDLILTINERLITLNKSNVLEEEKPGAMISAAHLRKFAYIREKKAFSPLVIITLILTAFNICIAYKYWGLELVPVFMWAVIGFITPLNAFAFGELLINRQVKAADGNLTEEQHGVLVLPNYLLSSLAFLVFYLGAGIAFRMLL